MVLTNLLVSLAAAAAAAASPPPGPLVLDNVTVIDGTGAAPSDARAIVIENGRIAAIGPAGSGPRAANVRRLDLKGGYLLPGLIDGHVHLTPWKDREKNLAKALASGITSLREMGGDVRVSGGLAKKVRSGELAGPDIYNAANFFGPSFLQDRRVELAARGMPPGEAPWMRVVTDKIDLPRAVAAARDAGVTGLKLYSEVAPDLVARIVAEAHKQGLMVWSHATIFPSKPGDAVAAGVDSIVHNGMLAPEALTGLPSNYHIGTRQWMAKVDFAAIDPDGPAFRRLFAEMVRRGTIYEPTLTGSERFGATNAQGTNLENIDWPAMREWGCKATGAAFRAGVTISAGTDSPQPHPTEGAPVKREVEHLVRCGLTPMAAIVAATRNSARGLGIGDTHGTIEAGKVADLLVVSADPIADVGNLRKVVMTIKGGRLVEPIRE